ncbi:MAG: hypothetical protein ACFWUN_06500 [Pseudolactococcus raffinolactis]|jgi:hypothetical protein
MSNDLLAIAIDELLVRSVEILNNQKVIMEKLEITKN